MTAPSSPDGDGSIGRDWTFAKVYALGFLTLISAFNYLDRSLLGLALPAIKREMHVSDTMLGLVSGLAFLLFYSTLGVPIAWAADRWNRRNIIAIGFAFWSLMTMLTGRVASIGQLALARFLMGAGEASGLPPSNAMIADLFRAERRPLAYSIFGTAASISGIVFFPIMGWIAQTHGWRQMFMVAGVPGLLLALLFVMTVREPQRGASERAAPPSDREPFLASIKFLIGSRAYLAMVAGTVMMGLNIFAASTWTPTFLNRVHGMNLAQVAATIGPVRGLFGAAGVIAGGLLIDRLGRTRPHWRITLPALACILTAPAEFIFLWSDSRSVWLSAYAASSFLVLLHQGPIFAAVMGVARVRMRAVAISILLLFSALIGQAAGPLVAGMISDALTPTYGAEAIRYGMLIIVASALGGGLLFLLAGRTFAEDAKRAASPN